MPDVQEGVSVAPPIKATVADEAVDTSIDTEAVADAVEAAEAETSDAAVESSTTEEKTDEVVVPDEKEPEEDLLSEFTKPTEAKKDNVQKRIDQLTAQLKELKAENEKLKVPTNEPSKPVKYTDDQLKAALRKATDEGDSDLQWEIMKYMKEQSKQELIDMYTEEKNSVMNARKSIDHEWSRVVNDYGKAWDDGSGKEIYEGAKDELNLFDGSLLYRLAQDMYKNSVDENGNSIYFYQGGQRQAVADALNRILKKRRLGSDPEKRKLERSLAKAKRKGSIASTSSSDGQATRVKSTGDSLADYVAERKKFKNERM